MINDLKLIIKDAFNKKIVIPDNLFLKKIDSIDGLRGISILIVIFAHICISKNIHFLGLPGVEIFFVISGFLITSLLLKEKILKEEISLQKFYLRRFFRIVPVAYIFLITLYILNIFFNLKISSSSFISDIFFLKRNIGDFQSKHFWSLSIEEQFYFFSPIFFIRNLNTYILVSFLLIIILPFSFIVASHHLFLKYEYIDIFFNFFDLVFNRELIYILTGSLTSILIFKGVINLSYINKKSNLFFFIFLFTLFVYNFYYRNPYIQEIVIPYFFPIIISFAIISNLSENGSFFYKLLNHTFFKKIGLLSYSLYIWQQLFTNEQPWIGYFKFSDSIFFNIILLIIVSLISYFFIELPFLNFKKRLH